MSKGIPFDVAFSLEDVMRQGFCIAFGELEGGTFNWGSMEFEEPKER